jgi:hypothetical protein
MLAAIHRRGALLRVGWIACLLCLRWLTAAVTPLRSPADARPTAAEARFAADDGAGDDAASDPSDDVDDDDELDDVILPSPIRAAAPSVATRTPAWRLVPLHDSDCHPRLFRPPRAV